MRYQKTVGGFMKTDSEELRRRQKVGAMGAGWSGGIWSCDAIPNITVCGAPAAVRPKTVGL